MMKRNKIGVIVLFGILCLGLVACGKNRNQMDKDELKDSEYITGSSDKFDDEGNISEADTNTIFDDGEEGNASQSVDKDSSSSQTPEKKDEKDTQNTEKTDNENDEEVEQDTNKDNDKETDKETNKETNKEDEGWTGFY